jgi:hypothetical protein
MCYIDGQKNKYSVLNECSRMLKYNILESVLKVGISDSACDSQFHHQLRFIPCAHRNMPQYLRILSLDVC